MALVSKAKAAKLAGVSRTTIYRYANNGKLSMTGDKVDTSELIRVFGSISEHSGTPEQVDTNVHHVTPDVQGSLQYKISLLETQIDDVRKERDHWREKTDELTALLKAEQDNIRLLTHQTAGKAPNRWPVQIIAALVAFIAALIWFMQ